MSEPIKKQEPSQPSEIKQSDSSPSTTRDMTAKINEALPTSVDFSGDYSKPVIFTLTLPENQQKEIFASLTKERVFSPPEPKSNQAQKILNDKRLAQSSQKNSTHIEPDDEELEYDVFFDDDLSDDGDDEISNKKTTEISTQLWKDLERATFVLIDQDDFQITYGLGGDPHEKLNHMENMVSDRGPNSKKILKTLSHLPNQTTILAFLTPIKLQNVTLGGSFLNHKFDETDQSSVKTKETIYTIKKYANGDFEYGFLKREKIEYVEHSDGTQIPVNSQPQWQEDVSPENFGYEISAKIQISETDLRIGSLANVKIIEPVRLKYQLQFDEPM